MAKVIFGNAVADMRNKLGSVVYSRNRYGAYSREYVIPANTITSYRTEVRDRLATVSESWATLTVNQRAQWELAVQNFLHTDVFKNIIRPSGFNLFVKLNCNLLQAGVSQIVVPPLPQVVIPAVSLETNMSEGLQVIEVNADPFAVPDDTVFIISATPQFSPSINYFKNQLRFIVAIPSGYGAPYGCGDEYNTRFGAITEGSKIGFSFETVSTISGQKSPRSYVSGIVGA